MTGKDQDGPDAKPTAVNDNRPNAVQSGEHMDSALWSKRCLIPLVRFLARRAAEEDFERAANDNKPPKEECR